VIAAVLAAVGGCEPVHRAPPVDDPAVTRARDSLARATFVRDSLAAERARGYTRVVVTSPRRMFALHDSLGANAWTWVMKVNRVDSAHVRQGDTLVVPLTPPAPGDTLAFALSPFPVGFAAARDTAKLLLISRRVQAFAVYDSGRLVRWGPVSTGRRETPTPAGLYHTNWKDKERYSTVDESWLLRWYLNLDNFLGVSLHEYELPGRPASHSCVRLLESDARWLYGWADTWDVAEDRRTVLRHGTPVVVWGTWDWGGRAPWKRLPEDPNACTLASSEMEEALRILLGGAAMEGDRSTRKLDREDVPGDTTVRVTSRARAATP
jgi:hypothetical protein